MMINDGIDLHFLKTREMARLGIYHDNLLIIADLHIAQPLKRNLQPLNHGDIVHPPYLVRVSNYNRNNFV